MSWEDIAELDEIESEFAKYLIDLHFCGINRGSTLILWSTSPDCFLEVKYFTAHKLISNLITDTNFVISHAKIFKAFLSQLIDEHSEGFNEEQLRILVKYCGSSVNQLQQNWNWGINALEKIENIRKNAKTEQHQQIDKIIHKMENLALICIDQAMVMTQEVGNVQNIERKQLMSDLKKDNEIDFYNEWSELIQRMTHESAPWYNEDLYPSTFELDEIEGPCRVRKRFKRCALKIEEKFFIDDAKYKAKYQHRIPLLNYLINPEGKKKVYQINNQVYYSYVASIYKHDHEVEGENLVTETHFVFYAVQNSYENSIMFSLTDIDQIWKRRYQHKELGLEIFLKSKKSYFVLYSENFDRDTIYDFICERINQSKDENIEKITQKWVENRITNFEYLMELNTHSGRSYNDSMQYLVFPWIITSFNGNVLDLTSTSTFRKFHKTISTQNEGSEQHYKDTYEALKYALRDVGPFLKPYHYTSHYSNSGFIWHYLVRLPPFTHMFIRYQGMCVSNYSFTKLF